MNENFGNTNIKREFLPELNEQRQAKELGYKGYKWHEWAACEVCYTPRWVQVDSKNRLTAKRCRACG